MRVDEVYRSTIAKTIEESNACMLMHVPELDQIEEQLAKIVPNNFRDMHELLQFAIGVAKEYILNDYSVDSLILGIISNVDKALVEIRPPGA